MQKRIKATGEFVVSRSEATKLFETAEEALDAGRSISGFHPAFHSLIKRR